MAQFTNELTLDVKPFLEALKRATAAAGGDVKKLEAELQGIEADIKIQADTGQAKRAIDDVASEARGISDAEVKIDVDTGSAISALKSLESQGKETAGTLSSAFSGVSEGLSSAFSSGLIGGLVGGGVAGAAAAGVEAIVSGFGAAIDAGRGLITAQKDLAAATGTTGEEFEKLKAVAIDAYRAGVGESIEDANKIIAQSQNLLGDVYNPDQLQAFATQASALGNLYDKDVNEVLLKSSTFVKQFGLDSESASNLIALGLKDAGTAQDDFLDSISEYSQLAKEANFTAEEFVGLLTRGGEEGVFNTDKIADSLKEAQIRLKAGDITKTLTDLGTNVPAALQSSISEIVKLGETGQLSVKEVLQQSGQAIETAFSAGEISDSLRSQLQVAIAGTPAEDLGADLYGKIFGAPIPTDEITARAAAAGQSAAQAAGQYLTFDTFTRNLEIGFAQFSAGLLEAFDSVFSVLANALGPTISDLIDTIGQLFDNLKTTLGPILAVIGGLIIGNIVRTIQLVINAARIVGDVLSQAFDIVIRAVRPVVDAFGLLNDSGQETINFTKIFQDALQVMGEVIATVADIISTVFIVALEIVTIPLQILGSALGGLVDQFKALFGITEETGGAFNDAGSFVDKFRGFLDRVRDTAAGVVSVVELLKDSIGNFVRAIANFDLKKALEAFTGLGDGIENAFKKGSDQAAKQRDAIRKSKDDAEKSANAFASISKLIGDLKTKAPSLDTKELRASKEEIDAIIKRSADAGSLSTEQAQRLKKLLDEIRKQGGGGGAAKTQLDKALAAYREIEAEQRILLEQDLKRIELRRDLSDEEKKALQEIEKAQAARTLQDEAQKIFKATLDEFGLFVSTGLKLVGDESESQIIQIFTRLAQDVPEIPLVINPEEGIRRAEADISEIRPAVPIALEVTEQETGRIEETFGSLTKNLAKGIADIFKTSTDTQADELQAQEDNLKAQLKRNEISYQEYTAKLGDIDAQRTEKATGFAAALAAGLGAVGDTASSLAAASFDKVGKSADAAYKLAFEGANLTKEQQTELSSQTMTVGDTFAELGVAAAGTFAGMVADGASATDALAETLKTTLKAAVSAFIPTIFANFLAFIPPPFNVAAATAAVGILNGLIDRYLAFEQGGLVPGGEQLIRVNEAGNEFVMNAKSTKKYLPVLEAMNSGRDISLVGSDMLATLDTRLERVENAIRGLGSEISRRTRIEGELVFSGGAKTLVGTFDTMSTYNKRRRLK